VTPIIHAVKHFHEPTPFLGVDIAYHKMNKMDES